MARKVLGANLLLLGLARVLDAVSALDNIGLQTDRPRPSVELEEKTAGIAQHSSSLISSP